MQFLPHLLQPLDKAVPKAVRKEEGRAAIGAGGDELELTNRSLRAQVTKPPYTRSVRTVVWEG
jgi:hypothetical protein